MALEDLTGTKYLDDLNSSNPAAGDNVSEGDDHIRGIKNVLKLTFPNVSGAVTPTHTELNYVDGVTSAVQTQLDAITANDWVTAARMADNSVDSDMYVDGSIDNAHLADDAVDSDEIAAGAIDLAHMSVNSIDSDQYVDGSIDTAHIANDQITAALMADNSIDSDMYVDGSIDTAHIANDQITAALMADNSIDSDMYVDGSIDTAHLGDLQVTTAKIAADAITGAKLADNAVDSEHYTDGSIDTAHIANDQITAALMADNSIDSDMYVDGSIDTAHIADLNVTGAKLALDRKSANATDDVEMGNQHDYMFADADIGLRWFTAGAEEMRLEDDGDLHVDGDVIAFSTTVPSSIALKDNVNIIDNALEKLNLLRGVSFNYKRDGRESAGVIAEEVQDVLPQAVKSVGNLKNESNNLAVNYNALTSILIEAIKELTAKVEKLENK